MKWHDNRVVTVGSNIFKAEPMDKVERFSQAEKKKVSIQRPCLIKEYNKGMGNVDVFDGHVATYRISMWGKKWWWPYFINTVDCLKASSYTLYTRTKICFLTSITIAYVKRRVNGS